MSTEEEIDDLVENLRYFMNVQRTVIDKQGEEIVSLESSKKTSAWMYSSFALVSFLYGILYGFYVCPKQ